MGKMPSLNSIFRNLESDKKPSWDLYFLIIAGYICRILFVLLSENKAIDDWALWSYLSLYLEMTNSTAPSMLDTI